MGVHIEAFLLYLIIFFSQSLLGELTAKGNIETIAFSIPMLIFSILIYCVPSLFLIWFLLYRKKRAEYRLKKPKINDLYSGLTALPALLLTGLLIGIISAITGSVPTEPQIASPSSPSGWMILCVYCLFSAYLEESYFRFYLLSKKEELNLTVPFALIISALLFGICHIYEGFWGFLNALIAGLLLGGIFLKYKTIHGIAAAHALYNITAFVLYSFH